MFDPIKEILKFIIKRKSLFSKFFFFLTMISLLYLLFLRVPTYTSHAKIFINSNENPIPGQSFLGGFLGNQSDGARDVQILSEITFVASNFPPKPVSSNKISACFLLKHK